MSSGRTGPYFLMSKSMQKTPKAFPLWILPHKEPQAKAHAYSAWSRIASYLGAELEAEPR